MFWIQVTLNFLISAGFIAACSTHFVKLGPYNYRKINLWLSSTHNIRGNLINIGDLFIYVVDGKKMKCIKVLRPERLESTNWNDVVEVFNYDNDIFYALRSPSPGEKSTIQEMFVNTAGDQIEGKNVFQQLQFADDEKVVKVIFHPKLNTVFYISSELNRLYVYEPNTNAKIYLNKQLREFAFYRGYFYLYTGFTLDRLHEDNLTASAETIVNIPENMNVTSIVSDYQNNVYEYMCSTLGPVMYNVKVWGNLEYFHNFSSCRAMIFIKRDAFIDDGMHFCKLHRTPVPWAGNDLITTTPTITPTPTTTTIKTTRTPHTTVTTTRHSQMTTSQQMDEDLGFLEQHGDQGNMDNFLAIAVSVSILLFMYFIGYFCYSLAHHGYNLRDFLGF